MADGFLIDPAPNDFGLFCREESGYAEWIRNESEQLAIVIWWIPTILGLFMAEWTLLYMVLCHFPQTLIYYVASKLINEPRPPTCSEMNDIFSSIGTAGAYRNAPSRPPPSPHAPLFYEAFGELRDAVYSSADAVGISPSSLSASWHRNIYVQNGVVYSPASPCLEVMIVWSLCAFVVSHSMLRQNAEGKGFSFRNIKKFGYVLVLWSSFVTVGVTYAKLNFVDQALLGMAAGCLYGFCCAYYLEYHMSDMIPHLLRMPAISWVGYSDNVYGWNPSLPDFLKRCKHALSPLSASEGDGSDDDEQSVRAAEPSPLLIKIDPG